MFYCTFDLVRFGTCKTVMELMNYLTNVKVLSYGQKKLLVVVGNLVQMIFYFLIGATGIFNFILEMKSFSLMYFGFSSIVVFQLQYLDARWDVLVVLTLRDCFAQEINMLCPLDGFVVL